MLKNNSLQKIIPLDSKKKDMHKIEQELLNGWVISNMMPHENGFLCVLEKSAEEKVSQPKKSDKVLV